MFKSFKKASESKSLEKSKEKFKSSKKSSKKTFRDVLDDDYDIHDIVIDDASWLESDDIPDDLKSSVRKYKQEIEVKPRLSLDRVKDKENDREKNNDREKIRDELKNRRRSSDSSRNSGRETEPLEVVKIPVKSEAVKIPVKSEAVKIPVKSGIVKPNSDKSEVVKTSETIDQVMVKDMILEKTKNHVFVKPDDYPSLVQGDKVVYISKHDNKFKNGGYVWYCYEKDGNKYWIIGVVNSPDNDKFHYVLYWHKVKYLWKRLNHETGLLVQSIDKRQDYIADISNFLKIKYGDEFTKFMNDQEKNRLKKV